MRSILSLLFIAISLTASIFANESHSHHSEIQENTKLMFGYQIGYSHIASKNDNMPDDSGLYLGVHVMKHLESGALKDKLLLASGIHTTFTEEKHVGAMIGIMYKITDRTILSVMPGIMWMKHSTNHTNSSMIMQMTPAKAKWESEYGTHFELSHEIHAFDRILNPSIGYMSSSSHNQYTFGLNFHF